nr:uncharacterized protein LOC128671532 [Plodia interpunctella]
MSLPYGPPQPVSPLIRGVRWALLIAGIFYARGKQVLYNSLEARHQEEQAKKKIIRDKELAILKEKIAKEEAATMKLLETGELFEPGRL